MKLILKATLFQQLWERQNRNCFIKLQFQFHYRKQLTKYLFEKTTSHNHRLTIINTSQQRGELPQTFYSLTKYVQKFPHCQPAAVPQLCQYKSFLDHTRNWTAQMTTLTRKETPNANQQGLSSLIQYLGQYYTQLHWHKERHWTEAQKENKWP